MNSDQSQSTSPLPGPLSPGNSSSSSDIISSTQPSSSNEVTPIVSDFPTPSTRTMTPLDCLAATVAAIVGLDDDLTVSDCSEISDMKSLGDHEVLSTPGSPKDNSNDGNQVLSQATHSCILLRDETQRSIPTNQMQAVTPVEDCHQISRDEENAVVECMLKLKLSSSTDTTTENSADISGGATTSHNSGADVRPIKGATKRISGKKVSSRSKSARSATKGLKPGVKDQGKKGDKAKDVINIDDKVQPVLAQNNKQPSGKTLKVHATRASGTRKCPGAELAIKLQKINRFKARSTRVRTSRSNIPGKSRYWTPSEHKLFIEALVMYGPRDLKSIAAHVKTRNTTQCRTHEQKCFMRLMRWAVRDTMMRNANGNDGSSDDPNAMLSNVAKDLYSVPMECGISLLIAVADETTRTED